MRLDRDLDRPRRARRAARPRPTRSRADRRRTPSRPAAPPTLPTASVATISMAFVPGASVAVASNRPSASSPRAPFDGDARPRRRRRRPGRARRWRSPPAAVRRARAPAASRPAARRSAAVPSTSPVGAGDLDPVGDARRRWRDGEAEAAAVADKRLHRRRVPSGAITRSAAPASAFERPGDVELPRRASGAARPRRAAAPGRSPIRTRAARAVDEAAAALGAVAGRVDGGHHVAAFAPGVAAIAVENLPLSPTGT